ncbi:hypothetical protein QLQ12_27875 [Actinoplanes sp. NEAU-A12]|uniref:Uncharacterized protein n=1 Tax=Actinoplanes sandaracinus TaxID=3045177 RepID=A0ABT6WRT5_9ACTN|nr:hypothetical protein [Actinoplanes sandaracinus]MDI6102444.1 hypothetical protein [Actinoplanes sandaracinus]
MTTTRNGTLAWLGHPVTMAALALLIVNDHVLKNTHPGWVTGKLSDAAGMVLAPPLLAALAGLIAPRLPFRRLAAGSIVTVGLGFGFVKASWYGAELASALWSLGTPSLIRADPTDLLAWPFLGVAWWSAGRSRRTPNERLARAVRAAVLLPLALAGVAATSPAPRPSADRVILDGDLIYAGADHDSYGDVWTVSADQGTTWAGAEAPKGLPGAATCARSEPVVCYRTIPHALGVESSTAGGPWTVSWRITDEERKGLNRKYQDTTHVDELSSHSLAVLDVEHRHVVVVANGRDGFALRTVTGEWKRIGFPGIPGDEAPISLEEATAPREDRVLPITLGSLIAGFVFTVAGLVWLRRSGGGRSWWWLLGALGATTVLTLPPAMMPEPEPLSVVDMIGWLLPILAILGATACSATALIAAGRKAPRHGWIGWVAGVGVALLPVAALLVQAAIL